MRQSFLNVMVNHDFKSFEFLKHVRLNKKLHGVLLCLVCILFSTENITLSCLLPELSKAFIERFLPHQSDRVAGRPSTCLSVCLHVFLPISPASSYTEQDLN